MNKIFCQDEAALFNLATKLAPLLQNGAMIYLQGELGAGKTTLARAILKALGFKGHVKSPTYTIVETYSLPERTVFHFDLYRIKAPQELLDIGLEDYLKPEAICLVEWPEYTNQILPAASLSCEIKMPAEGQGRYLHFTTQDQKMIQVLEELCEH